MNKSTKIVTGYWMDIQDPPWVGTHLIRKDRYMGSLVSICRGFRDCEIICYTHGINLSELEQLREEQQLSNLTIKIKELADMSFHPRIQQWRVKEKPLLECFPELTGRPPEVMWGKFEVLQQEIKENREEISRIYWIDVGLHHPGIFPWRYCPVFNEPNFNYQPLKQWNFTLLLNQDIIDKANQITENKILILVGTEYQNLYYSIDNHNFRPQAWPIAGFFGGDTKVVNEYCDLFWKYADKHLNQDIVCVEQSIMKYANDFIEPEKLLEFTFQCHGAWGNKIDFHSDEWVDYESSGLKPLYTVWKDILNY